MTWSAPMPLPLNAPASILRTDITSAPLAPDSAHVVEHLVAQVKERYAGRAGFNSDQYNAAVYTVDEKQPYVPVGFRDEQRKLYTPDIFKPGGSCASIPIPDDAVPSPGTDGALTIYEPGTGRLWELWRARRDPLTRSWSCVWAGRVDNMAVSDGFFPSTTGCSATGVVLAGEVIGIREAAAGVIEHAVGLAITRTSKGVHSWPARRNDGWSTHADAIHEGRRFRLPADLDLSQFRTGPDWAGRTKPLHPLAVLVARAVQKFGFLVTDTSHGVGVACEWGGPTKALTGVDPWVALRAGTPPYAIMDGFPWQHLQALPFDWGLAEKR